MIADPLEVQVDVLDHGYQPEIRRDGRLEREQIEDAPLDAQIAIVQLVVARDHRLCPQPVAAHEGVHSPADGLLGQSAHFDHRALQIEQLGVEAAARLGPHPNRPVT